MNNKLLLTLALSSLLVTSTSAIAKSTSDDFKDIDLYDENYRFNYAADAWRPDTPEQNRSRDRSSNDKFGLSEGDSNRLRELNPSRPVTLS